MSDIKNLLDDIKIAASPGREDRGMLAALRRGLSEATEHYAWPYLAPYCPMSDPKQRTIWLMIAAAAATLAPDRLARAGRGVGNLGVTLRKLALGSTGEKSDKALASFEARFRRLLTCQATEEICRHLSGVIRAAAAKGVPVDVEQLFWDLQKWERTEEPTTKIRWAQTYWSGDVDTDAAGADEEAQS
jgi:CRISPR type I-E-associated protein CasB/Cse2